MATSGLTETVNRVLAAAIRQGQLTGFDVRDLRRYRRCDRSADPVVPARRGGALIADRVSGWA